MVAARIDRLPAVAKETIQVASVIGQRFGDRVLREAGGARLADSVDELIAADLVLEAAPGERREGRYRFKHAIVQEVAYNTLLLRRRIELHRRVAVAYETVLGEGIRDFLPALAHHYLLGEVAYKMGDISLAEFHFDKLAAFYPDFRHLKSLLFAIDLRSMVNIKL